jgi:hypothetical protein
MSIFRRRPKGGVLVPLKTPVNPPAKTILIPLYPEDVLKAEKPKGN